VNEQNLRETSWRTIGRVLVEPYAIECSMKKFSRHGETKWGRLRSKNQVFGNRGHMIGVSPTLNELGVVSAPNEACTRPVAQGRTQEFSYYVMGGTKGGWTFFGSQT